MADALVTMLTDQQQLFEASEQILTKLATDQDITADELRLIHRQYPEQYAVDRQAARMRRVLDWSARKLTVEGRNALRQEVVNREGELAARKPAIEAEIKDLQKQLADLEASVAEPRRKLHDAETACTALCELLPPKIVEEIDFRRRHIKQQYHDVVQVESRLKSIEGILRITERRARIQHLQLLPSDHPYRITTAKEFRDSEWEAYTGGLRDEQAELRQRFDSRRTEREMAENELTGLRQFYVLAGEE